MGLNRRSFVSRAFALSGFAAGYAALQGLGLTSTASAEDFAPPPRDLGQGRSVLVLGAGIAGPVAAYELERAGFPVAVVEARERVGGRNWTIRGCDTVETLDRPTQTAGFSKGLYFNAGPARLPSHHQGALSYAKALGVPLEIEGNSSRSSLLQSDKAFGSKPIQQRQAVNDLRGELSELQAKAARNGALDQDPTADDRQVLLGFLKTYGDFAGLNAAWSQRFGTADQPNKPARSTVKVAGLVAPDALVEIEVVAARAH